MHQYVISIYIVCMIDPTSLESIAANGFVDRFVYSLRVDILAKFVSYSLALSE
jgi:hypothetical protein